MFPYALEMARYRSANTIPALGDALMAARLGAGKTRAEAAEHLGVTVDTIEAWETARTDPKCWQIVTLALFYGVAPTSLFLALDVAS